MLKYSSSASSLPSCTVPQLTRKIPQRKEGNLLWGSDHEWVAYTEELEEVSACEAGASAPVIEVKSVLSMESRKLLISCTVVEVPLLTVLTTIPSTGMGD